MNVALMMTLSLAAFAGCNQAPLSVTRSAQSDPTVSAAFLDTVKQNLPMGQTDFSTKASGSLSVSGTTQSYYAPDLQSIHAHSFRPGTTYTLRMNGNGKLWASMWKKINGVWTFSRLVTSEDTIRFDGGSIDFTELSIIGFMSWDGGGYSASLEQSAQQMSPEDLGRALLGANYETITQSYLAYYNGPYGCINGYHPGIDYRARTPLPVYSPVSGRVTYVNGSLGQITIQMSGSSKRFMFLHLSSRYVGQDAWVNAGDQIGLTGDVGAPGSPHLHVEVRDGYNNANCYLESSWDSEGNTAPNLL